MTTEKPLPLQVQILLLRQKMAQQRLLIQQYIGPQQQQDADQFPRSLGMRLLQQQLSGAAPWLMVLKNKLHGKESALLWSVALTLGQHWLQKKRQTQD
ncbi:hypothetical protein [Rheinheimera sp. 1928-s]|uniref:hypothetical protein n=1 Tax=Rheinheimera sp. 1928-s TaxID=3033803 RepID=UPI0026188D4E|nr:hypothetical protein [Rheinheimera sp. 1928-s]MDF3127159.1 hypothetical protein [Rheinheimera sp. 1928-s]